MIIAIDGPAGSGKGTITALLAKELGLTNIDTGAMYRVVTLAILEKNIALEQIEEIKEILATITIVLKNQKIYLNDRDVTREIRTDPVNNLVSQVSHIPEVRAVMVKSQREMGKNTDVIMEGRDIGTNVFPNAEVKIYLDASPEERAKRRYAQNLEKGIKTSYEEVLKNVIFRDNNDKNSKVGPLKIAEDAIIVDTTCMTIQEVVEKIKQIIQSKISFV